MDDMLAIRQVSQAQGVLLCPLLIGLGGCGLGLDAGVTDDHTLVSVHQEHGARRYPAFAGDGFRGKLENANLGGQHNQPVSGGPIAGGAQTIAIQRGTDQGAVSEGHRGRPVPRLHHE